MNNLIDWDFMQRKGESGCVGYIFVLCVRVARYAI